MTTLLLPELINSLSKGLENLPSAPDAECDLCGAVLKNEAAFDLSKLNSSDFYNVHWRWIWEAFEAIRAANDHIDLETTIKELQRLGRYEEITTQYSLEGIVVRTLQNVEANARKIREMVERRQILVAYLEQARHALNLNIPWPDNPNPQRIVRRNAAFALRPRPPIQWIVERTISRGSVNLFFGEPGAKKTYSMLSLAVCVAKGQPWLDIPTQACKVLIIDEESGENRLSIRLAAALRGEVAGEETPLEFISLASFHLDDDNDKVLIEKEIIESGAELVIFDALADLMLGDENSKKDTQPICSSFRRIAERTGAALCIIHHSNKSGGYRGSSAIKGAVDLMVSVTSEDGSDYVEFKSEKNRDGEALSWAAKTLWTEGPETFLMMAANKSDKGKTFTNSQDYVIQYLTDHGASSLSAIKAGATNCSPESARKAVYYLASLNLIHRINPEVNGMGASAIYDLVKKEI